MNSLVLVETIVKTLICVAWNFVLGLLAAVSAAYVLADQGVSFKTLVAVVLLSVMLIQVWFSNAEKTMVEQEDKEFEG